MQQRKRPGGDGGLGYYTSWEKSIGNGCIYCGKPATTREHVPSKAFLYEPFPENLPTMPACFDCNNGYSNDEKYVACFLDVLKNRIYYDYACQESTAQRLEKDSALKNLLDESIRTSNGKVFFEVDENRLCRILLKLARGHAGFEFDYVNFDDAEIKIWYDFLFNIPEDVLLEFNRIPESQLFPEVGSRSCTTPFIVQNVKTGEARTFMFWNDVQEHQYRYQVSLNDSGGICVKIIIFEFLYCRIDFD